ncbi:MAG: helix-turn-helix domain-containing protein [Acidobacteriota bacterium]|nr:helix-turn-helix domain-containing protein [Acidobacteriota bacterium]
MHEIQVVEDSTQAAALLDETRRHLLLELREPASAPELGRRLGLPRQRVGYHLKELERAGLVELVEERRKRNCLERVVRASSRSYVISPRALGDLGRQPAGARDRFSWTYLVAVASRAIRDLGVLRRRADDAGQQLPTLTLEAEVRFASIGHQVAFAQELRDALASLVRKYHDESGKEGRTFRVIAGSYPKITRADDDAPGRA